MNKDRFCFVISSLDENLKKLTESENDMFIFSVIFGFISSSTAEKIHYNKHYMGSKYDNLISLVRIDRKNNSIIFEVFDFDILIKNFLEKNNIKFRKTGFSEKFLEKITFKSGAYALFL